MSLCLSFSQLFSWSLELKLSSPTPSVFCMWSTGVRDHDGLVRHITAARAPLRGNAPTVVCWNIKKKISSLQYLNSCKFVCSHHVIRITMIKWRHWGKSSLVSANKRERACKYTDTNTHIRAETDGFKGVFYRRDSAQRSGKFLIQGRMCFGMFIYSSVSIVAFYLCFKKCTKDEGDPHILSYSNKSCEKIGVDS